MSEIFFRSSRLGYPPPVCSELEYNAHWGIVSDMVSYPEDGGFIKQAQLEQTNECIYQLRRMVLRPFQQYYSYIMTMGGWKWKAVWIEPRERLRRFRLERGSNPGQLDL